MSLDHLPAIDPQRLAALHQHSLLHPRHQPALARVTRILASALNAPIAFISIIDGEKVTLTATQGIPAQTLTSVPGLCVTTIAGEGVRILPDTLLDPVAARHPLVARPSGLRFYAGVPITTADGFNLGSLCLADTKPRQLTGRDIGILHDVGAMLIADLDAELTRESSSDAFQLREMLQSLPVAHFTCRLDGTVSRWSEAAQSTFEYTPEQIIGRHVSILALARTHLEISTLLARVAVKERIDWFDTVRVTRAGEMFETQDAVYPLVNEAGDVVEVAWASRDVRELKRLDALIWESHERFEAVVESIADGVVMTDVAGNVEYLNPTAQALTGWTTATARGKSVGEVVDLVHKESLERAQHPIDTCLREGIRLDLAAHSLLVHRDGRTFNIEDIVAPVRDRDGAIVGAVMVFRDTSGERADAGNLAYLGSHDPLTGLANRRELESQIEAALVTAARENVEHTLLLLELPQHRLVAAAHGRVAADELLKQVAALLRAQIRDVDMLARFGEDQFAVLLRHCPAGQASRIAGQLQKAVGGYTFVWHANAIPTALRISVFPVHADIRNATTLFETAETTRGLLDFGHSLRHRGLRQQDDFPVNAPGNLDAERAITSAFTEDRFRLYAQKIVPLLPVEAAQELYEFLVHMVDGHGRLLSPAVFVGAASRDELAADLDRWVVRSALRTLSREELAPASSWTINISTSTLNDDTFPAFVHAQLARSGVPPQSICFELSETAAVTNLASAMRFTDALKALGCRFSLSQFGTSLNTYAYLRNLKVDYLKIDGSLVRDIVDDPIDRAVVGSISHIAHVMGIQTIAEHVEDITVLEVLKELGIDYAQGYAIAKPLPLTILS
ncbi:MAG: EAL domain-containing protein [Chloroflexia bacterium]|nr:EAL domain-containing protein [Chloroflexia bacterium]